MKYFLLLFIFLVPSTVKAQGVISTDSWPTHIAIGSYMTLQGIDLATTEYALGTRRFKEGNPIVAPLSDNPVVFGAFKMITAVGTSYFLLRYHRKHPKVAFWTAIAANVFYTGIVTHNARLLKQ